MSAFNGFQIVGLIRFSVLTQDFRTSRLGSLEDMATTLFSDERMAHRFRLFEELCLPTLRNQTDQDFELLVLTSQEMPEKWLSRLRDLVEAQPNMRVVAAPRKRHFRLIRKAYQSVAPNGCTHRLSFRLDDDDALDLEYIARLKRIARTLVPLWTPDDPIIINFLRGYFVEFREDGENRLIDTVERNPLALGTALMHVNGADVNPYRYNHRQFAEHYNMYTDISVPTFLRTVHDFNASTPHMSGSGGKIDQPDIEASIARHFGLDPARIKAL